MGEPRTIAFNLRCRSCGYILRGLPEGHACPECGTSAPPGVALPGDLCHLENRETFGAVAEGIGFSLDAVLFVVDCVRVAQEAAGFTGFGNPKPISTADICRAVCDYSIEYFEDGSEAKDLFTEWGIQSSEDVGRIVFALVESGFLQMSDRGRIEDFTGNSI